MRAAMRPIASTAVRVDAWTAAIWAPIWSVARGFARAGRLDGGIERQEIGLPGDTLNELDHVANRLRRLGEPTDLVVCDGGFAHRVADEAVGLAELAADLVDRG
jgi:hypothetical protein